MTLVRIGWLGRAHGLRGEIALEGASLEAGEVEEIGSFTWKGKNGETRPLELSEVRPVHGRLLVCFKNIGDRDQVAVLTRGELMVEAERLPDPGPNTAYTFQLIGLTVETIDGRRLGTLESIIETGVHPVYVVAGERELLIPATPEVVQRVDLEGGIIRVALPLGLEELG